MEKVDSASERFGFDAICAIILLLTALLGAYCPKYLSQQPGHQANGRSLAFSLGNMLSGGVMLSAGFCHLLADSLQIIVFIGRFPITTFLAAVGFIITLCADQVVQHFSEDDDEQHPPLLEQKSDEANIGLTVLPPAKSISPSTPKERHCAGAHNHDMADSMPILDAAAARSTGARYRALHEGAGTSSDWHDHGNHMKAFLSHKPLAFATSVLLAAALCVHSILEGMALGAQRSIKGSEDIMIAIVAHKGLAAYALGSSVIDSKVSAKKFWTVVGLFALATPVGIFTGYGLAELSSGSGAAALSALASGTFLYVAMMEVIPKELEESRHRLLKMTSLLLGFGLMSMLAIWA